jgi:hypothetical protein
MKLRDHLVALLAGNVPQPRGHVLIPETVNASAPFATACQRLVLRSHARETSERVSPPSDALPPLP